MKHFQISENFHMILTRRYKDIPALYQAHMEQMCHADYVGFYVRYSITNSALLTAILITLCMKFAVPNS
jgi:hypothetical protein